MSSKSTELVVYQGGENTKQSKIKLFFIGFFKILLKAFVKFLVSTVFVLSDKRVVKVEPSKMTLKASQFVMAFMVLNMFVHNYSTNLDLTLALVGLFLASSSILYAPKLKRSYAYAWFFISIICFPGTTRLDLFTVNFVDMPLAAYSIVSEYSSSEADDGKIIICDNGDCNEVETLEQLEQYIEEANVEQEAKYDPFYIFDSKSKLNKNYVAI